MRFRWDRWRRWDGWRSARWLVPRLRPRKLAISVQGTSLRLLLSERRRALAWAEIPFNPAFLRSGFIGDTQGMSQMLRNAPAIKGMLPASIVASFPGFQSIVRVIRLPNARDIRPKEVLTREARRLMAFSEEEQVLFWQAAGATGAFRDFLVVAVPRAPVRSFVETLRQARLAPSRLELAPLCLMKVLPQGHAVLASVESNSIDIVIVVDSLPTLVRSLWVGDEPLTIDSAPARVAEELVNVINFYNTGNPDKSLAPTLPIHLAGGFPTDELAPAVARETGRPVTPLIGPLAAPADFPATAMAVNVGLVAGN